MDGTATPLGDDVHLIDTRTGGYDSTTSAYLIRSERPALRRDGAARSAEQVLAALHALGVGPDDLATLVVTHTHLDHAGGVGDLASAFPRAEVVVHERGARHLVDPARLPASARTVFGDVMGTVFGALLPTPAERVRALGTTGEGDLGGVRRRLSKWSPGHASHHVGLLDSLNGDLYVGDAAGICVPEADLLRPATPPPDVDLPLALASIDAFRDLQPTRLLFSLFGPSTPSSRPSRAAPRNSSAGSSRRGGPAMPGSTSTARSPRSGNAPPSGTRPFAPTPRYRRSPRSLPATPNLSGVLRWLAEVEPRGEASQR